MGRFTNGPNWLDVLADNLGVERPLASLGGGTNYAYSGATTGSVDNRFGVVNVDDQVAIYLGERKPIGNELFLLAAIAATNDFAEGQTDVNAPVQKIGQAISDLAVAGAKSVLVMNNISSPRMQQLALSTPYNVALSAEVAAQRQANPDLTIYEFDADEVFSDVVANASEFGFMNLVDSACGDCGGGQNPNPTDIGLNPNEFLFWDNVHFTGPFHEVLGNRAALAVPEPSAGSMLILALLILSRLRGQGIVGLPYRTP